MSLEMLATDAIVWDNHVSVTMRPDRVHLLENLRRYSQSGVNVICLNVWFDGFAIEASNALLSTYRAWLAQHADEFTVIGTVDDIERAKRDGKLAVCFNLEGGKCLQGQVSMVSFYYDLGVRWMEFTYNRNNELAGGCQDEDQGLTPLGRTILTEMERVGMVACCSHLGHRSAMEIIELSTNPVIFSHSNPRRICDHPRNLTDEAVRACASTGGVVGVTGLGLFLGANDIRTETFVRHVDYLVNLVGPDNVGLGIDCLFDVEDIFDYVLANPALFPPAEYSAGLNIVQPEQIPEIAEALFRLGYAQADVANIMGGNLMRIARKVWK